MTTRFRRRIALVLLALGAAMARPAVARQAQPPARPTPTFKSGVELVSVDVTVVDKDGRPVPALQVGDFEVSVDGRPRRVVSAEFLSTEQRPARTAGAVSEPVSSRVATSNEGQGTGRLFAIVVDVGNIQPGGIRAAVEAATRFIRTLGPDDRVALFSIPSGPSLDFTADRERVIAQLGRITGQSGEALRGVFMQVSASDAVDLESSPTFACSDIATPPQIERLLERNGCTQGTKEQRTNCCQLVVNEVKMLVMNIQQATGQSLAALESLMVGLGRVDGPKTVVLISQRLINGRAGALDRSQQLRAVGEQAAASRVNLYVLHVSRGFIDEVGADVRVPSSSPFSDDAAARDGLATLAGASRGTIFSMVSGGDRAFERIGRETSAYYLLGLETAATDRDGKPHRIRVRLVERKGYDVRSRAEFVIRKAAAVPPLQRLTEMLRSPLASRGLPMRLATRVLPSSSPSTIQLVMAADIGRQAAAQDLAVGFVVSERGGRTVTSGSEKRRLTPVTAPDGSAALRYTGLLPLSPGRYRLKVAAVDEDGQGGSVEHDVDATVTEAGPLLLGDVILAAADGGSLSQGLSLDDSVSGVQARAFIQMAVREQAPPGRVGVTVEVADTPTGRALLSSPLPLGRSDGGLLYADGPIDLRLLPPGDYVARATVTIDGRVVGTRTTAFHLVAAAPGVPAAAPAARGPAATLAIGADRLLIRPFDRTDVLRGDVVSYFVDRLAALAAAPADGVAAVPADGVAAARAAARTGAFAEIPAHLQGADEASLDVRFLRGLSLYAAGSLDAAAAEFRAALKAESQFLPAAFYLGACYAAGGHDREAVGAWQMALVSEGDARIVYEVLVDAFLRLREPGPAGDFLREAQDRWSGDAALGPRAAAVAAARGDARAALDVLEPFIAAHPEDATALFLAMRLIFQARMEGKAVRGKDDDAAAMARFAQMYDAARGPDREIVARWRAYVIGKK